MAEYFLYLAGQFIALSLPLSLVYRIAVIISDVRSIFAGEDRKAVAENLKIIFPDKSDREIALIRRQMFRNFAKYLADFFRFSKVDKAYVRQNVRFENLHYFDEVSSKGKGVIIVSAHLGNWELGGAAVGLLGYPVWAVALPHKNKKVNDFFNSQRESKGLKVIQLGKAVRQCLHILGENQLLALVGDRDFTESGAVVSFFGKPAYFPEGPAALCLKTGAPIIPVFMLRDDNDGFVLKIEKPISFTPSGDKHKDIPALIERYKVVIEQYIRTYPEQWYMFRRFWIPALPQDGNASGRTGINR
jgi:KDO2-lipid IV(A) lauroyltransferase